MAGFEEEMIRRPVMACFIDEFGDLLALINGQGQNVNMSSLIGTLKLAWNSREVIKTAPRRGVESETISEPAVTLVGATTKRKFFGSVTAGDIESGFANRVLILPFEDRPEPDLHDRPVQALVAPPGVLERLKGLAKDQLLDATFDKELKARAPVRIGWTEEANAIWKETWAKVKALKQSDPWRHEVSARAPEQAIRLATVVAAGRGSKRIEREDMAWAAELAWMSAEAASDGYAKYMEKTLSFAALCQEVFERIQSAPDEWCSTSDLKRFFRSYQRRGFELGQALAQLVAEERIVALGRRSETGLGRPSPGYVIVKDDAAGFNFRPFMGA
jgi:hypothetical protein